MTNSEWVTLLHAVCEWQSHHIFFYNQQLVSDIAQFVKGSPITFFSYNQQFVSDIVTLDNC